jgi:hypothetical protein
LLADLAQAFAAVQQAMAKDGASSTKVVSANPARTSESTLQTQQATVATEQSQQEFRLNPALAAFW